MSIHLNVQGAIYKLTAGITIIGRGADADLRISEKKISSSHCRIQYDGSSLSIEDLGSRNGTFINNARISTKIVFNPGDSLRLGDIPVEIVFEANPVIKTPGRTSHSSRGKSLFPLIKNLIIAGVILIVGLLLYRKMTAADPRIAEAQAVIAAMDAELNSINPMECKAIADTNAALEKLVEDKSKVNDLPGLPEIISSQNALLARMDKLHRDLLERHKQLQFYVSGLEHADNTDLSLLIRITQLSLFMEEVKEEPYCHKAEKRLLSLQTAYQQALAAEADMYLRKAVELKDLQEYGKALRALDKARAVYTDQTIADMPETLGAEESLIQQAAETAYAEIAARANEDVQSGQFEKAAERYVPVFNVFGIPVLAAQARQELARINAAVKAREESELARVKTALVQADAAVQKRMYTAALKGYRELLPRLQVPSIKKRIEDTLFLIEAGAAVKQMVITYINQQVEEGGLLLREFDPQAESSEVIAGADIDNYYLADTEQPDLRLPFRWQRMGLSMLIVLAGRSARNDAERLNILALYFLEDAVPADLADVAVTGTGPLANAVRARQQDIREEQAALLWSKLEQAKQDRLKRRLAQKLAAEYADTDVYRNNSETIEKARTAVIASKPRSAQGVDPLADQHPVPQEHPRLFGSRDRLKQLSQERSGAYSQMQKWARTAGGIDHTRVFTMALTCGAVPDEKIGRAAIKRIMPIINGPIRTGHQTFGHDLAFCAIVYDMCHEFWSEDEAQKFFSYMNRTIDANVRSESQPTGNAYYGYKNWGIGLACYATYYENPKAPQYLKTLHDDYRKRAAPTLELAGAGGGWAEGHYIHYFLYYWLVFCEAARFCEGIDYYAMAPAFYAERAKAGMFELYPGVDSYRSLRSIPMGDGGGRTFGGHRWNILAARRILVNYFADDPQHQMIHTFNEKYPDIVGGDYDYQDFLWYDRTIPKGDLTDFPLSHISTGPGYVYARSSWKEDATYLFFKCGDRFTSHQHLDNGHFLIYKYDELAGDGGHYNTFGSSHDVNYQLRTIAHSTILVNDTNEKWPPIRSGPCESNDGGQHHDFANNNGYTDDAADWNSKKNSYDIADMKAFEDKGSFVYMAGDFTRSYKSSKVGLCTRQIVYIRPDTFIIFDQIISKKAEYNKIWNLQAMTVPTAEGLHQVITNGKGRLFIQTLLPAEKKVELAHGNDLYKVNGKNYPAGKSTGPAPQCRIAIAPVHPATADVFLHVLTAASSGTRTVSPATAEAKGNQVRVAVQGAQISFFTSQLGGTITINGQSIEFTGSIQNTD